MNISEVEVLFEAYLPQLKLWAKEFIFDIDEHEMTYKVRIESVDNKDWMLDPNGVNFMDHKFESYLEGELEVALENNDEEDAASIYSIFDQVEDVRINFESLIPKLLKQPLGINKLESEMPPDKYLQEYYK